MNVCSSKKQPTQDQQAILIARVKQSLPPALLDGLVRRVTDEPSMPAANMASLIEIEIPATGIDHLQLRVHLAAIVRLCYKNGPEERLLYSVVLVDRDAKFLLAVVGGDCCRVMSLKAVFEGLLRYAPYRETKALMWLTVVRLPLAWVGTVVLHLGLRGWWCVPLAVIGVQCLAGSANSTPLT